jgi:hypothetical protein
MVGDKSPTTNQCHIVPPQMNVPLLQTCWETHTQQVVENLCRTGFATQVPYGTTFQL